MIYLIKLQNMMWIIKINLLNILFFKFNFNNKKIIFATLDFFTLNILKTFFHLKSYWKLIEQFLYFIVCAFSYITLCFFVKIYLYFNIFSLIITSHSPVLLEPILLIYFFSINSFILYLIFLSPTPNILANSNCVKQGLSNKSWTISFWTFVNPFNLLSILLFSYSNSFWLYLILTLIKWGKKW